MDRKTEKTEKNEVTLTAVYVANAGQFLKLSKFKQTLSDRQIDFHDIFCQPGKSQLYILFDTQDKAEKCLSILQSMQNYQGHKFKCKIIQDFKPTEKRRNNASNTSNIQTKHQKVFIQADDDDGGMAALEQADDCTELTLISMQSPLVVLPISEQNEKKCKMVRNSVSNQMHRVIQGQTLQAQHNAAVAVKAEKRIPLWVQNQNLRQICLRCPPLQPSPVQRFYRSKGEFMIQIKFVDQESDMQSNTNGQDDQKKYMTEVKPKFRIGSFYRIGGSDFRVFSAEEMKESIIFPQVFPKILKIIEDTLLTAMSAQEVAQLAEKSTEANNSAVSYVILKSTGHLEAEQELQCSENTQCNCNQLNCDQNNKEINIKQTSLPIEPQKYIVDEILATLQFRGAMGHLSERRSLLDILKQHTNSLSIQEHVKVTFEMYGDGVSIQQKIDNINLRVSAASFCQVNLAVQQLILRDVVQEVLGVIGKCDLAEVQEKNKIFQIADLCCGGGVIGQYIAAEIIQHFKSNENVRMGVKVIGVEIVPEAVQAAEAATDLNGLAQICKYVCGPAESNRELLNNLDVAVLDPPRSGAHPSVLTALRQSTLQTLIYISCNPKSLASALYTLCSCDKHQTIPFYVSSIKAFDMFPGCAHVETLAVLQRTKNADGAV